MPSTPAMNISHSTLSPVQKEGLSLSNEDFHLILIIVYYGVSPAISAIGVTGNVFSLIVLVKHGLHKCSNIILLSLAISDICFLVTFNSIPGILYIVEGGYRFLYSRDVSQLLYVLYYILYVIEDAMTLTGLALPVLVTFERLVAVFYPLKLKQIVTPCRTWTAIISIGVYYLASVTYAAFWTRFDYVHDSALNRSVGMMVKSDLFYKDIGGFKIFEELVITSNVFPILTFIGCIAIIIKVKQLSRKREAMTSRSSSTSRTTKTVLVVCLGYVLTRAVIALPAYLPLDILGYNVTSDAANNISQVLNIMVNIWLQINSSWNFFIYITLNKNFRDTFKEMFKFRVCCKRQKEIK